ncbi:type IV pilin N-terminal domain-containing protein [Methanoregula sp.]|uniref:type IV pilin N-terminal domain-containing protein n=1 Tax=Methanoregula sp. TaxID=2052170 RepID=UPI00261AC090|nr:type IV pilin N-terminal domain-containing protein [Methanoregula sp.]MDD5142805.1 type IV pilin N-terminal domain-containing protein [Methanoregula sp.]
MSPVVGVMLMLSVTVLIAAIVSTYAGGFTGGAEKSPQSSIRASPNLLQHRIYFEHNGGDPFMLSSIKVVLREHDNKTSFSLNDAETSLVRNFSEIGSGGNFKDTTIQAGDTFFSEGEDLGSNAGMKFGNVVLKTDTRATWLLVDKASGRTISMGSFVV